MVLLDPILKLFQHKPFVHISVLGSLELPSGLFPLAIRKMKKYHIEGLVELAESVQQLSSCVIKLLHSSNEQHKE